MQKSRKVNTKAKKREKRHRKGSARLVPDPSPGGGDRPEQSGALGVRSGGDPREAERAHLRHHHAAVAATGRLVAGARRGVGGDGEHQRVLDSPLRTAGVLRHRGLAGSTPGSCATFRAASPTCRTASGFSCCTVAGLLRGSFRPHEIIVRVRTLHRQLSTLGAESTRFVQWMQKALDQMNVQIHRAVTDLTGQTGMAIVRAIVDGERDPVRLQPCATSGARSPARSLSSTSVATGARSICSTSSRR